MSGLIFFSLEFHIYIKKNVLTKEQLESGWTSTDRAKLGWSFYLLLISLMLIITNILLINAIVRIKHSQFDLKSIFDSTNSTMAYCEASITNTDLNSTKTAKTDNYTIIDPYNSDNNNAYPFQSTNEEYSFSLKVENLNSPKKLKKIIDFIY